MRTVGHQRSAELQTLLEGVALPASKQELLDYALHQDPAAVPVLESLPDRRYGRLDDVGEALAPAEPERSVDGRLPRPESGKPPGGEAYLDASARSGAVRSSAPAANPPQKALAKQTKTQRKQKKKQQG